MKLIWRDINPETRHGVVKVLCEDLEDMWHLYKILQVGDTLGSMTFRNVDGANFKAKTRLTIRVTKIDMKRIKGTVTCNEDGLVRHGQYHTLVITPDREFTIGKERWDFIHLQQLTDSLNPHAGADLAAVVMQEGLAHVLTVSNSFTMTRAKIERSIPRKGKSAVLNRQESIQKFFQEVLAAILQNLELEEIKVLLIASPGYVKDEFYKYINLEAERTKNKSLINAKKKIVLCHSSTGHRHALQEVMSRPEIMKLLKNTKAVSEVQTLQNFFTVLKDDEHRAVYGPPHVLYALSMGAIDTLLVVDELFRSAHFQIRDDYVAMVEDAKKEGAKIVIFSGQHVTGKQLKEMSGVAAILRYPLPDINEAVAPELEAENDSDSSSDDTTDEDDMIF